MTDFEYKKIFFDTAPYIYLLDYSDMYREYVKSIFEHCIFCRKNMLTSVVTIEEFCVKPYRDNDLELIKDFQKFIEDTETTMINISGAIARKAAMLRAILAKEKVFLFATNQTLYIQST